MRGVSRVNASVSSRSARTRSGRCTYGSSRGSPSPSRPATGTRWVVQSGMTGSCGAGAFTGRRRLPSPSTAISPMSRSWARAASASTVAGGNPSLLTPESEVASRQCPCRARWASSAAQSIASFPYASTTRRTGACIACDVKIRVVVVVTTRRPAARASSASRKSALVLPPAPTSVTTESASAGSRRA